MIPFRPAANKISFLRTIFAISVVFSHAWPEAVVVVGGRNDLPPPCRTKVMEQSPLISENSGYETIQVKIIMVSDCNIRTLFLVS
jgi:hypothetical protein